jgi:hypothetical protein
MKERNFMTRYNHFAKRLDDSFKAARNTYNSAYSRLQQAERAKKDAENWTGKEALRAAKVARTSADLIEAQENFESVKKTAWENFFKESAKIRAELVETLDQDAMATADQVDGNGLKLLESGILTPAETLNMVKNYSENPAMARIVGKFAQSPLMNVGGT